jgi:hypothetical protein
MDSVIAALKDTPVPTILVVAGIVFLLLSIAGQLAGRIAVPPERQRQAAMIGGLLVVVGIALHVAPSLKLPSKPPDLHRTSPPEPPPEPGQAFPTKYDGVMASITRFAPSGAFIILEITVKNGTNQSLSVCGRSRNAQLIDQESGERWKPVNTGGDLASCHRLRASQVSGTWMQFEIPNPEKRVFSLNSDLFNRPVENLVLEKPT